MMRTTQITLNEMLLQHLEQTAYRAGIPFSEFIQQLLRRSLREWVIEELEQQEIEAYQRQPIVAGEFDVWESEQAWGRP